VAPELQRPLPPYLQITQFYRDRIESGELKEGDRVPSARQIVDRWKVAHATAAKVLSTLRGEGLVTTTSGGAGGTVVARRNGKQPADSDAQAAKQRAPVHPPGEHSTIAAAEIVRAPKWIADALEVDAGADVIRRHRLTYRDATPVAASTSWFDAKLAELAPALLATDRLRQGTTEYLSEQTGRAMAQGREQMAAGVADDATAADLDVSRGSPVLVGRNWVRDRSGAVLEYAETVSVPGRWSTYEWQSSD
jgi:DNA-binding GntR family transcriptional regulator